MAKLNFLMVLIFDYPPPRHEYYVLRTDANGLLTYWNGSGWTYNPRQAALMDLNAAQAVYVLWNGLDKCRVNLHLA